MQDLRLLINGVEVDLSEDISIHYTYTEDDLNNPTVVKNSFSKTVVLEGTKTNNDLFGHYWNIERRTGGGFNASKKAPFQLYVGTELYESGYVKLDSVACISDTYKYNITLYGGLGDFFYNLNTNDNTGDKLKLSDLEFGNDLEFTIDKDTVKEAWDALENGTEGKWQDINFMPAYNGLPDDFDANKVVINTSGTTLSKVAQDDDGKYYYATQGFVLGELPEDMTEWETRDMRSYNQRPCIRMKAIVEACCDPRNNGGYTVDLDPDFFYSENPYWERTWMTLPQIQSLKYTSEEQTLEGATLMALTPTGDTNGLMYQDLRFELGNWSTSIPSSITVKCQIGTSSGFYKYSSYIHFWNWNGDDYHSGWGCFGSLFCQLIAMNGDVVVGASNVLNLTSPIRHNGNLYYGHNDRYTGEHQFKPYLDKTINNVLGTFENNGFTLENASSPATLSFTISNLNSPITALKMVYYWGANGDKLAREGANILFNKPYNDGWTFMARDYSALEVRLNYLQMSELVSNATAVLGESIGRTGTKVSKKLLLDTDASPCEYLLSYTKMFGLYWVKDIESKTVHLMTRKTFYQRDNVKNLTDLIDYSKDHTINPLTFDTKWFEFSQEKDSTQFSESYKAARGVDYGCKILNTGYEFNSDKKKLLKDNVIRSGIEGLEKSKYYTAYNNDRSNRPWFGMGLKYNLVNDNATYEVTVTARTGDYLSLNEDVNMKYYDLFPKLQFRDKGNDGTDGNNVLVFFSGFKNVNANRTNPLTYALTDDTSWQTQLNDGKPCWLFTPNEYYDSKRLAYFLGKLPVFERYLTGNGSGSVWRSLDFGTAQELFIPSYNITEDSNIYSNFWKTYLEDLYDVDTKKLECFVRVKGKPNDEWLRCFYWFDNTIWRLNKINDWSVGAEDTTQMTFVKVQDIQNYTSKTQNEAADLGLIPDKTTAAASGETISVHINASGLTYRLTSSEGATMSITGGTGSRNFNITLPANTGDTFVYWNLVASSEYQGQMINARTSIRQNYEGSNKFVVNPTDMLIPASGKTVEISLDWFNQGSDYVTGYTKASSGLDFTVDYTTKANENIAIFTFGENSGQTTLSNYCEFQSNEGVTGRIGFDQPASGYSFSNTGGTKSFEIEYDEGLQIEDVPYWAEVTRGASAYTITARRNDISDAQHNRITLTKRGQYVEMELDLEAGSATSILNVYRIRGTGDVSPSGDTIYLQVESNRGPWSAVSSEDWATLTTSGDVINVAIEENDDEWRQTNITVTDSIGSTFVFTVSQDNVGGGGSTERLEVIPSTIVFNSSGGTATFEIRSNTMWTIEKV